MCVLFKMSYKPKMLILFDWFLKQTNLPEDKNNLNIAIRFKSENLIDLCRYEQRQFLFNSDSRKSLQ